MPLSPLSRTLLRSLLRLSRKPLPRNLQLMDHPLPMPPSIDRIVSSKALRNAIMLCFRNGPDTPSNSDSAFFCLRQLLREHDYAKELLDKAEKRTKLSYIYKKTFELGDVVLHKHTGVRGVVMGWDFDSDGAQLLYLLFDKYDANRHEAVVVKKKSKRPNFQNMSPDWLSNMRLAASYSLVTDPLLQRVHHDSIPDKFSSFDAVSDRFVPKFDWQLRYPEDVKHVSMQPLEVGVDDAKGSDAVAVQMRKSSSIANVRLSLDSLYAALDKILHEAMSKSTYGAGAGFSADPGQPGSELGMLLYLDAFCHSVCAPGSHESQNSFLRDRFRDILRRSDKTLSGKNNDISASADPRIRALEEELVQELSKWKQDNERPSKRVECYNQMHQLNILYESLLDMLLKRFDNRSDLIDALNSIRDASGSSLLQSNKDVNSMDQSLCENMNKLLAQENRIGDEMLMPGDIVFDSQHESYGVCVERDRRAQFVLNVPRPSRRMAEDVWMIVPMYNNADADDEGDNADADDEGDNADDLGAVIHRKVYMASELDLKRTREVELNDMFGSRLNSQVYDYFSSFDEKNGRFVPFVDVFLRYGRLMSGTTSSVEQLSRKNFRVAFRSSDYLTHKIPSNNILADWFSREDEVAEKMMLQLYALLHGYFCGVQTDLENIEPLRHPLYDLAHRPHKRGPRKGHIEKASAGIFPLLLGDVHALLRLAENETDAAVVQQFCTCIDSIHPSFAVTILTDEAQVMMKLGYMNDASKIFEELLRTDNSFWCAHIGRVVSRTSSPAFQALGELEVVLASRPDMFSAWVNLANLRYYLGHNMDAINCLRKALLLHPWAGSYQTSLSIIQQEEQQENDLSDDDCSSSASTDGGENNSGDWVGVKKG